MSTVSIFLAKSKNPGHNQETPKSVQGLSKSWTDRNIGGPEKSVSQDFPGCILETPKSVQGPTKNSGEIEMSGYILGCLSGHLNLGYPGSLMATRLPIPIFLAGCKNPGHNQEIPKPIQGPTKILER